MAVGARSIDVTWWRCPWAVFASQEASARPVRVRRRRGRRWRPDIAPGPTVWSLDRDEIHAALERAWR